MFALLLAFPHMSGNSRDNPIYPHFQTVRLLAVGAAFENRIFQLCPAFTGHYAGL
jgi:hypothetical protein